MALFNGTQYADSINIAGQPLGQYETGHRVLAGAGNDSVYGSIHPDQLEGEAGADLLYGYGNNDCLVGSSGNDTLYGGVGNDALLAGADNDHLLGEAGDDTMYGGSGNDVYYHSTNGGVDMINDDKSEAGNVGYGGGTADIVYFTNVTMANLAFYHPTGSNNLWISSLADFSDGYLNDGVIIEDFYLGGNNVVESLYSSDGYSYNLASLI